MSSKKNKIPRGIRNNNPLNLRVGFNWIGEVEHPTDHAFEQFTDMKYGVRAAFKTLKSYINRHKCNTVRKIISRWAPPVENNTENYIKTVCKRAHLGENDVILFENTCVMIALFEAMCFVENGQEIDVADVLEGYKLAL